MKSTMRVLAPAGALLMALSGLTGCGSTATGSRSTIATIQGSSYVTIPPATTTTTTPTTTLPGGQVTVPGEQTHTVVAGDSVYKIAALFSLDPTALASYNEWPEGIQHPLYQGDIVRIPPGSPAPGSGAPATTGAPAAGGTGNTTGGGDTGPGCSYTIVAGDYPGKVASAHDITVEQLAAANSGNPAYTKFLIGQQLNIPPEGC